MTTTTKQTMDLRAGDRVQLRNGLIRTVSHVLPTNYLNRNDEPIFAVYYREGDTRRHDGSGWSSANTSNAHGSWTLADEPPAVTLDISLHGRRLPFANGETCAYVVAWSMVALTNGSAR